MAELKPCPYNNYNGAPPICRAYDLLLDKHDEVIYGAAKYAELKKKYTEE